MATRRGVSLALWYVVSAPAAAALMLHSRTWEWSRGAVLSAPVWDLLPGFVIATIVGGSFWLVAGDELVSTRGAPPALAALVIALAAGTAVALLVGLIAVLDEDPALTGRRPALRQAAALGGTVSLMTFAFLLAPLLHRALSRRDRSDVP